MFLDNSADANLSIVEIAMKMGYHEVLRLLVDAGADINLAHPVWPRKVWPAPGHSCLPVRRAVYIEVRAGLEVAVAGRKEGKAGWISNRCSIL
ncbi:hypothetical protein BDW59DRAFT_150084 [Aspergillus cavernicola]|uniref:Ankyrin repeat-containing domain protein n=1 Tax=Aspergillus cavernicola TaxID=176166 RepID=A0ABR4I0Z6_9EURO